MRPGAVGWWLALALCTVAPTAGQDQEAGRALYERWCAECHGFEGGGDGPAAPSMLPRPRDFTQARYQIRTTGSGQLPTDADLLAAIENGLPGTTMPGWPNLSGDEKRDVIAYIKSFSRFFAAGPPPEPMDFGSDPGGGDEALRAGAAAYVALECEKCHGEAGRGYGTSAPTLEDWRGFPIRAADLTEAWFLNGGSSVEAIHTRVLTGLDGTPMPAAIDAMNSGVVSPDQVWYLAHYVASMGPRDMPRVRDVVRVGRVDGPLPQDGSDEAWAEAETFYFPLAGQIVEPPRNFSPTVDGIYVQGLHDGTGMALRIRWHDPSESPDPAWDEWTVKILAALDLDGADPVATDSAGALLARAPDAFAIQFPFEMPEGMERPYFLRGDARNPVYLWMWSSEAGLSEGRARGLGNEEALVGGDLAGEATWEEGRWTLVVRRPLISEGEGLDFAEGLPIPVAFQAWDGSSGETGRRGSISTWYYVLLEQPASRRVVIAPLVAVLLTGALGLVLVRRARNEENT